MVVTLGQLKQNIDGLQYDNLVEIAHGLIARTQFPLYNFLFCPHLSLICAEKMYPKSTMMLLLPTSDSKMRSMS